jgi:hypothetical protein
VAFEIFGRRFGAPPAPSHPALAALLQEVGGRQDWYVVRSLDQLAAGKSILAGSALEQAAIAKSAFEHVEALSEHGGHHFTQLHALAKLISALLRRDLPFSEADVVSMLAHARVFPDSYGMLPTAAIVSTAERFAQRSAVGDAFRQAVARLRDAIGPTPTRQEDRRLRARLDVLLGAGPTELKLTAGQPLADAVSASLASMSEPERQNWRRLLGHAQSSDGAKPSKAWLKQGEPLLALLGAERVREQLIAWLEHVRPPKAEATPPATMEEIVTASRHVAEALLGDLDERTRAAWRALTQSAPLRPADPGAPLQARMEELIATPGGVSLLQRVAEVMRGVTGSRQLLAEQDADMLRGLVWSVSLLPEDPRLAVAIGDLAERCLKKVPNYGAYSAKVGNACIWTLGAMTGMEPVAQLGRLRQRVKYPVSLRLVDKAMAGAAQRASISPEDLEELAVPAYGLTEPGLGRVTLGDYTGTIRVGGIDDVELRWTGASGRQQKTVPQEVQHAQPEELRQLKRGLKDIDTMLPAQRDRIERIFGANDRHWRFAEWRARYLDHPLLSVISRRLIWHFKEGDRSLIGGFHEGRLVGVDGAPLQLGEGDEVRLWHPLGFAADTVLQWRDWLREREIRQPFKQAHREIYVLTDAELQTATYSNRFAAHIIRQHQFAALCRERGWRYHVQGNWDSHNVPTLSLPGFDLRAEFWVEPLAYNGAEESGTGVYMQLATDQVRFTDTTGLARLLSEVPALVFSEVMRDVDLFVGVTSIAADPTWADRGDAQTQTYWQSYAFGELNASAATRREVLVQLLPKLKIASVSTLEGRFLRVQGRLANYKIHLGSTNVLMEPNDRYLCIVPDRRMGANPTRGLALPFEGDNALAIIISKALLLAADDKIADQTILRQIRAN